MTTIASRITAHMAASLDGYIANDDDSFAWLNTEDNFAQGVSGDDAAEFVKTIDCYVIGARTYETALKLGWPYGDTPTWVLSHRQWQPERPSVSFYAGDLPALVNAQLKPRYRDIWVAGGSTVVRDFIRADLVDDIRLTLAPVLLGGGVPFFDNIGCQRRLHLREVTAYRNGFVSLWHEILRPDSVPGEQE